MKVQSTINSILGSAALFAGLYKHSPGYQEKRQTQAQLKNLSQQEEKLQAKAQIESAAAQDVIGQGLEVSPEAQSIQRETGQELESVLRESYNINPTQEAYNKLLKAKKENTDYDRRIAEQANDRAGNIAQIQGDQAISLKDRLEGFKNMSMSDRREFLKQATHIQAQEKRQRRSDNGRDI